MNQVLESRPAQPGLAAIKQRQQATWASGDFAVVGTTLQIVGESLAEAADVRAGERVLDVAAGNGNATLAAARRFAQVTSTDYVPALLEKGRERARAEGLPVEFKVADAEALPFDDGAFDAALSTYGVMFTADHARAAHWVQVFRDFYGPTHKAFAALDAARQGALEHDIVALLNEMNMAGKSSLLVPSEYLEVVLTKR